MKNTEFIPADFDTHGRLRLPFLFARTAASGANMGAVSDGRRVTAAGRRAAESVLSGPRYLLAGIVLGTPAVLAFIISGHRQRFPRLWPLMRWLLALPAIAVGLATTAVDERRIALGGDHRPAGGGSYALWCC